jgi:TolB protein
MHASLLSGGCRVALLLVIVAVVTLTGFPPGPASSIASTFPGTNGEIAVVKDHHLPGSPSGNGTGIFVVRPDGSGGHWLFTGRGRNPSWSPDGNTVLFVRANIAANLWIADRRGQHEKRISTFPYNVLTGSADWSPDGKSITLIGRDGIYVAKLVGGRLSRLTRVLKADVYSGRPVWSPSAQEIAFVSELAGRLAVVSAAGDHVHVLATGRLSSGPSWSPDGRRLAFMRCTPRGTQLSTVRPDGSGFRDLARIGSCHDGAVAWSPDGKQIAFVFARLGTSLQAVSSDGKNHRIILRKVDGSSGTSWQPVHG